MPPPPVINAPEKEEAEPAEDFGGVYEYQEEPVELSVEAEDLLARLQRGRRRRAALATAATAVVALTVICGTMQYAHYVLSYAELAPEITLRPDSLDPERVLLRYRPVRAGRLAFRRAGAGRETELLDEVAREAVGRERVVLWRAEGLADGERIGVRYRNGWRLTTYEITVTRRNAGG